MSILARKASRAYLHASSSKHSGRSCRSCKQPSGHMLTGDCLQEIDKAVKRGIYHVNNAARKKSRLAQARQKLLIACGIYRPASMSQSSMSSVG